jgi:hypothetical protein
VKEAEMDMENEFSRFMKEDDGKLYKSSDNNSFLKTEE